MRPLDLLRLSTRMFRTRRSRTVLTILGVSVGIGAIFFLVSLGYGLQKLLLEQITTEESLLTLDVIPSNEELIPLTRDRVAEIVRVEHVAEVSPLAGIPGQVTMSTLTSDVLFYATSPVYFRLGGITASEGKLFDRDGSLELVFSSALAKSFGVDPSAIIGMDATMTMFVPVDVNDPTGEIQMIDPGQKLKVIGIVDDDFTAFAYVPSGILGSREVRYGQVKVKVSDSEYLTSVREQVINMGFLASALAETVDEANKIFGVIQIVLAVFGFIALIVSAIGMANTMTVTLMERTGEIGIMKAIGASDGDIARIFVTESTIMGFLGGFGGIAIGFLLSQFFNVGLNIVARSFGGQSLSLFYTPLWFLTFIILFSGLVGFITGILPARRGARMNPLDALRYK